MQKSLTIPSMWRGTSLGYPPLEHEVICDCAVIGGGLCGILCAHLLSSMGLNVVILEENELLSGKSGRSTAKATVGQPMLYSSLMGHNSPEVSRKAAAANENGIKLLRGLCSEIHGAGKRADMFFYSKYGSTRLRREYNTMLENGISCGYYSKNAAPIPDEHAAAIRIYDQIELDVTVLGYELCRRGLFKVYEHSKAENIGPRGCTANGHRVKSGSVICTTNYPIMPELMNPLKLYRKTSSVIVSEPVDCEILENSMAYCCDCGYGIRHSPDGGLVISGEAHRGSPEEGTMERLTELLQSLSHGARVIEKWTNNDVYTHDMLPYVGKTRAGVYLACGFNAWGMVSGASAAVILSEEVCGREVWYADIFSPERNFLRGGSSSFSEHIGEAVSGSAKKYSPAPELKIADLKNGEGGVVNYHGKRMGAFRDDGGEVHLVSLRCPHIGCELEWNAVDCTWDCPCHGSRFTYDGEAIGNPAVKGIKL